MQKRQNVTKTIGLAEKEERGRKKIRSTDHRRRCDVTGGKEEDRNARNVFHLSH
jgi:hypothetical protein